MLREWNRFARGTVAGVDSVAAYADAHLSTAIGAGESAAEVAISIKSKGLDEGEIVGEVNGINAVAAAGGVTESGVAAAVAAAFEDKLIREQRLLTPIVDFGATETWNVTGAGATQAADTTEYALGAQSILHTVPAGIVSTLTHTLPISKYARGNICIQLRVKSGLANCSDIKVELYETAVSGYHQAIIRNHATNNTPTFGLQEGIWKRIWIRRDMFGAVSSPTNWGGVGTETKTIGHIRVIVIANGSGAVEVNWGAIETDDAPTAGLLLSFDDAYESVYTTAFPLMQAAGLRGCVVIYRDGVGTAGLLTASQIDDLVAAGWDVCNHTKSHNVLDTETDAQALEEMTTQKRWQQSQGWNRGANFFCYPGTLGTGASLNLGAVTEKVFLMARGEGTRTEYTATTGRMTASHVQSMPSPWIWHDWVALPWRTAGSIDTTFANEQSWYDQVIRDRLVADMVFHRIVEGGTPGTDVDPTYFSALVNYAAAAIAAGTLENITFTDWAAKVRLRGF